MKRTVMMGLVLAMAGFAGANANANETKINDSNEPQMTEQELASLEASLFASMETLDTSSDAKFAEQLQASEGNDGNAKCWFWCWRRRWVAYPRYYYQTWYCPTYYVPLRIVTYAVPVVRPVVVNPVVTTPVVTTPAVATPTVQTAPTMTVTNATATATATATASVIAKFLPKSDKVAKGAVIDGTVPDHSPLKQFGIRSGDIITKVDGNPINSMLDVRRITKDSSIEFISGKQIKVAGKPILQNGGAMSSGAKSADVTVDQIKALQETEMSLYDYYDNLEKKSTMK